MKTVAIVVLWALCGLYGFGTTMAYFDYKDDHDWSMLNRTSRDNTGIAAMIALFGPLGAIGFAFNSNFNQYGWHLWQKPGTIQPDCGQEGRVEK